MKKNNLRPANSAGMFDLAKFFLVLSIFFLHTLDYFHLIPNSIDFINQHTQAIVIAMFICSGYGIRKMSFSQCISKQIKPLLKAYVITGFLTSLFHLIIHYLFFHSAYSSIVETVKVFLGYCLGLYPTQTFSSYQIFSVGPLWYLVTLINIMLIMNFILKIKNEKSQFIIVIIISAFGSVVNRFLPYLPYCICQSMTCLFYCYAGYMIRKHKLLHERITFLGYLLLFISIIGLSYVNECSFVPAFNSYPLGPLTVYFGTIVGFFIVYFFTKINRRENLITLTCEPLGHNSLYLYCAHSIEYTAVPWYMFFSIFPTSKTASFVFCLILRMLIIFVSYFLVINYKKRKIISDFGKSGE